MSEITTNEGCGACPSLLSMFENERRRNAELLSATGQMGAKLAEAETISESYQRRDENSSSYTAALQQKLTDAEWREKQLVEALGTVELRAEHLRTSTRSEPARRVAEQIQATVKEALK